MRYERTERFAADYRNLSAAGKEMFRRAVRQMNAAYADRGSRPLPEWPGSLRVRNVEGAPGIWEMTWSFSGPDGRATFEIVDAGGEPAIRWRRIGGHRIFREP